MEFKKIQASFAKSFQSFYDKKSLIIGMIESTKLGSIHQIIEDYKAKGSVSPQPLHIDIVNDHEIKLAGVLGFKYFMIDFEEKLIILKTEGYRQGVDIVEILAWIFVGNLKEQISWDEQIGRFTDINYDNPIGLLA